MTCALCQQVEALHAHRAGPRLTGRVQLDRAALRRALGGGELVERAVRASGRPTANVGVIWRFFTTSVYQSGDLPVIATREALQNSLLCGAPHKTPYAKSVVMWSLRNRWPKRHR